MYASRITARAAAIIAGAGAAMLVASSGSLPVARAADVGPQDKVPASYGAMMSMKAMDVMHMMDAGNEGQVSRESFMKFHEALFEKMDRNKDGRLSQQEWLERTDRSKDAGG
jgi:hypothetical protein